MRDSLASLANVGTKTLEILARAGITSVEQLRSVGPVGAYLRAQQSSNPMGLNLLWTLEGALTDRCWREVKMTRRDRLRLMQALEDAQQQAPVVEPPSAAASPSPPA